VGVVKVLWQMKLLPRIITGSSGGAIVAAVVGTRTDEELIMMFHPKWVNLDIFEKPYDHHNWFIKLTRFMKFGNL
jgi:TAG lipase / steryl ester hydrolase / phospholipase A2 / LPA acyltransferase